MEIEVCQFDEKGFSIRKPFCRLSVEPGSYNETNRFKFTVIKGLLDMCFSSNSCCEKIFFHCQQFTNKNELFSSVTEK